MEIPKYIVSLLLARLARSKGFNREGKAYHSDGSFQDRDTLADYNNWSENTEVEFLITAPTRDVLLSWLREDHGIHVVAIPVREDHWVGKIRIKGRDDWYTNYQQSDTFGPGYETYDEAIEKTIIEGLINIEL